MFARLASKFTVAFSTSWDFFRPRKRLGIVSLILLTSLVAVFWLVSTKIVHADFIPSADDIMKWFAEILLALAGFCIKLTFFVLKFIIEVAGYNGFIDSPAVTVGWVMIRDFTNLLFVVVLLAIAFGTILGIDSYEYKHSLVKLIGAAILVNFSRVICGLIIDVAQVVMVTFVNGIAATASGNLLSMFQVDQIFKMSAGDLAKGTASAAFLAGVAALAFSVIMLVTMLAFLFMITARMVMLWILIALSPFAFVLKVLHQTESYASQWWGKFGSNVVSGPIIAFFLWLSFVTVGSGTIHDEIKQHNALDRGLTLEGGSAEEETIGITNITSWDKMANFIIAVAILLAGAKVAQELGVAGAGMMSSAGDIGKKVAMYASGYSAARWLAPKVGKGIGKGLYYGTNMIPGLAGIHPEAWKRRGKNIASRAKSWYYDHKVESTVKAGEISKAFAVNQQTGKYEKVVKVQAKDDNGNLMFDENKNPIMVDKKVDQKGFGDWAKRQFARARLETGAGYDAFHHAYSEDLEATAEAKHEQLDHLASTSSLPIGYEKQKAKEWLEFLEHTGANIKAGKKANMEDLREKIMHALEHGHDEELEKMGLSELEIFKAKQGYSRFGKSVKSKAESDITTEYVHAEHKIKEQEALKEMLESKKGKEKGENASEAKAMAEQLAQDIQQSRDLQLARARDQVLEDKNRYSEANNEQNTINEQVEQRIKKHSAAGDYVQSEAKTVGQLERIKAKRKELAEAKNEKEKKEIKDVLEVLERSLSEMQISNLGTHAAVADGLKGKILSAVGMSVEQSMQVEEQAIRNLQAQDLAELINEKVDSSSQESLEKALKRLEEIYGERANAMLEQKRLKNEKAAGQGSLGRAGLYMVDSKTLKTVLTNASTKEGRDHVDGRRQAGMSGSKLTSVIGFGGSMDKVVVGMDADNKPIIRAALKSDISKDIFLKLAAGLTGNNLGNVDEYTKADIGEIFENSDLLDLEEVLKLLKERMSSKGAFEGLLKFALEKNRMKTSGKIKAVEAALKNTQAGIKEDKERQVGDEILAERRGE